MVMSGMSETLYRLTGRMYLPGRGYVAFCAGLVVRGNVIVMTAPILKRLRGQGEKAIAHFAKKNGWEVEKL